MRLFIRMWHNVYGSRRYSKGILYGNNIKWLPTRQKQNIVARWAAIYGFRRKYLEIRVFDKQIHVKINVTQSDRIMMNSYDLTWVPVIDALFSINRVKMYAYLIKRQAT